LKRKLLIVAPQNAIFPNFAKLSQKFEAVGYDVIQLKLYEQLLYNFSLDRVLPHALFLSHAPELGFDGLEILQKLKASLLYKGIPVIVYSAVADVKIINLAYMLGANHYSIAFPPPKDNLDDLMDSLIRVLDLRTLVRYRNQANPALSSN
jgi:response regulator RpfG family c-di-GMP phosphodiesterase